MASSLVTGGQGFIGSALVRQLLEDGDEVTVLDLPEPPFRGLEVQGVADEARLIEGDVASTETVAQAIEGIERVFHLAAVTLVGEATADPAGAFRTNVGGTWTLLEALRATEPELVVVFLEAQGLEPPLTIMCCDIHLEMEGYPVEQGAEIEIPLLPPGTRGSAKGFG